MRLIDADALDLRLEALMKRYMSLGRQGVAEDYNFVRTVISVEETIDAVEVVRCKDCKYYRNGKHFTGINFCQRLPYYAEKGGLNTADDDFCSYGERKEE